MPRTPTTTNPTLFKVFGHPDFSEGTVPLSERENLIEKIIYSVGLSLKTMGSKPSIMRERLNVLSDSTIAMVVDAQEQLSSKGTSDERFITHVVLNYEESFVREAMFYRLSMDGDLQRYLGAVMQAGIVDGLHNLPCFKERERLEVLRGAELETAIAFVNVTGTLMYRTRCLNVHIGNTDGDNQTIHISDTDLQSLIMKYAGRSEEIIALINERETESPETIRECLENGTPLRNGVL